MRKLEFYTTPQGGLYCEEDSQSRRVTKFSDIVDEMMGIIKERFPEAYSCLKERHAPGRREGNAEARYRMVAHFIRCNFAERDTLSADYEGGRLHFEEVKCPLRGEKWLCPYEGKICKPRGDGEPERHGVGGRPAVRERLQREGDRRAAGQEPEHGEDPAGELQAEAGAGQLQGDSEVPQAAEPMSGGKSLCGSCGRGRNCVNGRYCAVRRMYVEHERVTNCENYEQGKDNRRAGG